MNPEPNPRHLRLLLASAAGALVVTLGAFVLLQPTQSSADWLLFFGRFHPLVVHLPIGVMVLVVAAEVASLKSNVRARLDPVVTPVLVVLVGTALSAFIAGLLLARGGGYPEALLVPHQRLAALGMILLCASLAAWSLARQQASVRWRRGYRALLGSGVLALGAGAHYGGSMTHGETYLVRYAPQPIAGWFGVRPTKKTPKAVVPSKDPTVFADVVQPLLSKYCVNCHGPDKTKGDLRLDSYGALMKGGESGPVIVQRAPEKSRLVTALGLPLADADHMPPEGKPQPTQAQVELISWWILRGADEHERVREVLPPAAVIELLKTAGGAPKSATPASPEPERQAPAPSGSTPAKRASEGEPASEGAPVEEDRAEPSEPASGTAQPPVASAVRGLVYEDLVAPLLAARCTKCHGSAKQKGRLRVDSLSGLEKGGKGGPAVVPGNSARSPLVARLRLPLTDDEHMPPKDEAQLTTEQIRLLEWWISAGAEPSVSRDKLPESLAALRPPAPAPVAPTAAAPTAVAPTAGVEAPASAETAASDAGVPTVAAAASEQSDSPVVPAPPELLAELPEQVALFPDLILPLLKAECGDCHLGEPLMGDLSVASFEDLMRADVIVPGEPKSSELLRRVTLPASDDDRMPPAGEDPLNALEIAALRFWILEGAEPGATWPRDRLPAEVARAVHSRLPARPKARATPRTPARVPPERATAGGCAACAVGVGTDARRHDGTPAALGLLVWLGAWRQRTLGTGRQRRERLG